MIRLLAIVGLLLGVALPFWGALEVGFLQDDYNVTHLLGPEMAMDGPTVYRLLHPAAELEDPWLRPISYLTLLADIHFFGIDPFALHLTGLLLHLIATALVFTLGRTLWPEARAFPWLAALFFGLNPVHANAVGWLAARSDPVVGVFSLATLLAYARYRIGGNTLSAAACMLLYACALLSKEAAVVTPGLALLMEPVLARRAKPRGYLPAAGLVLLTGAYLLYRRHLFGFFLGAYGNLDVTSGSMKLDDIGHAVRVLLANTQETPLRWILLVGPVVLAILFVLFSVRPLQWRSILGRTLLWVLALLVAVLPVMSFLSQTSGRHFYLAAVPLAGILAAAATHPKLQRGAVLLPVLPCAGVFGLACALGLRLELGIYVEAGRITAAVERDLRALRAAHPDVRSFIVGDLRRNWKTAPLFHYGFTDLARPPFQPVPVPVIPKFLGEARDLRWEAYMFEKPVVFLRLRTPPEVPGLEQLSPVLHGRPPRIPTPEEYTVLNPKNGTSVRAGQNTAFRFRVPAGRNAGEPLRLLIEFPGNALAPFLLGPDNLEEEPSAEKGTRTLIWRPQQGVMGDAFPLPEAVSLRASVPVAWWVEEADLDYPGVRSVRSSPKAHFRFLP